MTHLGHLSSPYIKLLSEVEQNKGVPCEWLPELFYPDDIAEPKLRAAATTAAKSICKACPILDNCFAYALETNQRHGIWGGTEPHER